MLQIKQNVALALTSIFLAALPSVLGFLPLWLTVCKALIAINFYELPIKSPRRIPANPQFFSGIIGTST